MGSRMSSQLRAIYSDAFLGTNSIKAARAHAKINLETAEPGSFIEKMHKEYEDNGIDNVTVDDVFSISKLADGERDLRLALNVARAIAGSERPPSEQLPKSLRSLLASCYVLNCVEVAQEVWRDECFAESAKRGSRLLYLMLLYNNGRYEALAELASSGDLQHDPWTVVLAALYKIGTREAYEIAKKNYFPLVGGEIRSNSEHRSKFIYALFASAMGDHDHAYSFIKFGDDNSKPSHYLRRNLELKILTDLERFEDALSSLRDQR